MINEGYYVEYGLEIDFILLFHVKLIGAVLRHGQTTSRGQLLGSVPQKDEIAQFGRNWDQVWWPLHRKRLKNGAYELIQYWEPLTRKHEDTRRWYRSWVLVHQAIPDDYDFDSHAHPSLMKAVGMRYCDGPVDPQTNDAQVTFTSYGSQPLLVAAEILRSGAQANVDRRRYWNGDLKTDVNVAHTT
ncbi:MAG: hypothetical protein MMC23_000140 [Stictis urceolatum]|nr:hypothetical protein [Stictis urceolata]